MILTLQYLSKDINKIDSADILSCWQWQTAEMRALIIVSFLGDIFFEGNDKAVYWLTTDNCNVTKVAENINAFDEMLNDENNIDKWFLPSLVQKLIEAGKVLTENQVYSYKIMPFIGGEYSIENIEPVDMSVHFAFSGQICEQIRDLPNGTRVKIKLK